MDDPLISLPGYALRRAANATAAELSARLAETGLRQSDISLLMLQRVPAQHRSHLLPALNAIWR